MPDAVAVANLIGSGLSLTGGLFSNATNRKIARENLAYQREANDKNMELVREANANNIAFQQRENEITRMREDNAVQRAAADMTAAGLSKTLAAGSPASASSLSAPSVQAASVSPVQNSFKYESALQRMNIAQLLQDMAVKNEQLNQAKELNDAQVDYIKSQTIGQNNINETYKEQFGNEQLIKLAQVAKDEAQTSVYNAEAKLKEIESEYKSDLLTNEVDKGIAQISVLRSQNRLYGEQITLTQKEIAEYAYKIAKDIAETEHLNSQTQLAVEELARKKLEYEIMQYNLDLSKEYQMRTTDQQSRFMGLNLNSIADNMGSNIKDNLAKFWNNMMNPIWNWTF